MSRSLLPSLFGHVAFLASPLLATLGCNQTRPESSSAASASSATVAATDGGPGARSSTEPATSAVGASSLIERRVLPESSSSAGVSTLALLPGETIVETCQAKSRRFSVHLVGDGPEQTFREGAPRPPRSIRSCEPAAFMNSGKLTVAACSEHGGVRKSCVWATQNYGAYFDRDGVFHPLSVQAWKLTERENEVVGTLVMVGTPSAVAKAPLTLRAQLRVGARVNVIAEPGLWDDSGVWTAL